MTRRIVAVLCVTSAFAGLLYPWPAHAATGTDRILWIGDSWVEGVGDRDPSDGLGSSPVVARNLRMQLDQDGRGGSGYVNPTTYGDNLYGSRVYRHPSDGYDVVVLQGSTNDKRYVTKRANGTWDTAVYAGRVNSTVRAARKRYPSALLVVVGPTAINGAPDETTRKLRDVQRRITAANDVAMVDPIGEGWFVPGDWQWANDPVTGHPNERAYAYMADRLTSDLTNLGVRQCRALPMP